MPDDVTVMPVRRVSRKGLYIPFLLFALACLGWTGFWFYARGKAIEVMDVWMAREARLGRTWTCPDRGVDGFPFRMRFSCQSPTFVSNEPGRAGNGTLRAVDVTARVVDPRMLIANFSGPLTWTSAAGDSIQIDFGRARASYRGAPGAIDQASLEVDELSAMWRAPGLEPQGLKAKRTEVHVRRSPGASVGTDLALSADAVEFPLLNALAGDNAPGEIRFQTSVAQLAPSPPRDWRQTLEAWRTAGGEARIDQFKVAKGPFGLESKGTVRLDEFRRLEGAIEGQATGLLQVLARAGLASGGGGILGGLLGGIRVQQNDGKPRPLPVNIRFENGRVWFGPIQGPRLAPLY